MRERTCETADWGDATPWVGWRSSLLQPPTRSFPDAQDENRKNRVWKLPQVWKHRTLPHLLGKPTERISHSSHTPFLLSVNQRGSVLVSSGDQKILSLDRRTDGIPGLGGCA